jgi:hypothetical protein
MQRGRNALPGGSLFYEIWEVAAISRHIVSKG